MQGHLGRLKNCSHKTQIYNTLLNGLEHPAEFGNCTAISLVPDNIVLAPGSSQALVHLRDKKVPGQSDPQEDWWVTGSSGHFVGFGLGRRNGHRKGQSCHDYYQ